uniref:Acetyl-coenzyme A carboxylase carboxyl transferase subunit beta, chloroplastic n=1 Tax=Anemopaegma chamberlaynii TaxID=2029555 RepID=A0A2L1ZRK1_9LAMI|nr:Acetyl-CoA carboxylase beta subunit [Anemopaegma chamberlaynii]AVF97583.1 Acetyl-CoA carboxylase beta subunit [Anemopaegma chamberlaynii]
MYYLYDDVFFYLKEVNMLVKFLNSKCCFGLNSSNWSFNPIFFKTQSSWGDGIKSSWKACGESGGSDTPNPAKGNDLRIREDSKNPKPKDPESLDSDDTNPDDSASNCFNDMNLGDSGSKDQKSTDGDPARGDSKNPKPKDPESNVSDDTHPDDPNHRDGSDSDPKHSYPRGTPPHIVGLWVLCEDCEQLNYKRLLKERNNMCEHCEYHFTMNSPERIEFLIDTGTWHPIDEDMASPDPDPSESDSEEVSEDPSKYECTLEDLQKDISLIQTAIRKKISERSFESDSEEVSEDPFESDSEEVSEDPFESDSEEVSEDPFESDSGEVSEDPFESDSGEEDTPYEDRLDSYRKKTGLNEAVQTGVGQLNGIPVAFGIMEFEFMGGSMGSVVGEKIARLVEYAINQSLPLIIVCASGGARMQEGSLSLMQMAKISCALLDYDQFNSKLVYISILASPTTGGVTASFGTLADLIFAEPNSYIAFAGKRVIEETLKQPIPEGSQEAEPLFEKGMLDQIIPRKLLKHGLTDFLQFHGFNPLNSNSIK